MSPVQGIVLCVGGTIVALGLLRVPLATADARRPAPASLPSVVLDASIVGIVVVVIAALARDAHTQWAGIVAGLPTLGLVSVTRQHRGNGTASVIPFLRGYVVSSLGKALFALVFSSTAVSVGSTPAIAGAVLAVIAFCLVVRAGGELFRRKAARAAAAPPALRAPVALNNAHWEGELCKLDGC
jgi:hypothetical protein